MATCRDIITAALKSLRVVYPGRSATAEEAADALVSLQSYYDELVGSGAFGRLEEYIVTAAYTAEENQRLQNASDFVITYPTTIEDADTGEDRPPMDRSIVVNVGSVSTVVKVYSAPLNTWQTLSGLTLNSTAPMAERGSSGLSAVLAMRLAPEYGKPLHQETVRQAARFSALLSHKFDAPYRATEATYF